MNTDFYWAVRWLFDAVQTRVEPVQVRMPSQMHAAQLSPNEQYAKL